MDHSAAKKGPRRAGVHQSFPYPLHKVGYQGYEAAFDTQIPWLPAQIHPGRDGVLKHLLSRHGVPIRCQN